MSLYSRINQKILLPLADKFMHRNVTGEWKLMDSMDHASEEELMVLQNRRLQQLMQHCYHHVPYYHKLFDSLGIKPKEIQTREDLKRLPIMTKQTVRDHYNELISDDVAQRPHQNASTGGSTGTPMQFKKDSQAWSMQWASNFRSWEWWGFHVGEKMFTLGGNSLVKKRKMFTPKDVFDVILMRNMKRSSADVSDEAMQAHYEAMMRWKPKAIRGYGSSLVILARYIEKMHLPVCPIKVIFTTSEILMPEYRATLERVFRCPVMDGYGAGDGGIDAHECPEHNHMHLDEERCIVEIVDKEGKNVPDGEIGYVISTDLGNYVFPFVRYQVGDMAFIQKEKCDCGRASRVIGQVIGRAGKLLYNKEGVPISPTMLPIMLYRDNDYHTEANCIIYNKIDKFQIRQDAKGDIRILLKLKDKNEDQQQFAYCVTNFENHFVGSKVSLEFVDEIPTMPSGKEDYCVSEYK